MAILYLDEILKQVQDDIHPFSRILFTDPSLIVLFTPPMRLPIIAIVGRPNVGKSTLFNRLIGKRYAITSPIAGTTRDRLYHEAEMGNSRAILVDTAGMEFDKKKDLEADIQTQARIGVEDADVIFFIIDATQQLTVSDRDCAAFLRKSRKPLVLIAHKSDNRKSDELIHELHQLGLGEPFPVSSIHALGLSELEEHTAKLLKKLGFKKGRAENKKEVSVAIVGKPNVGKSSIVNALLGKERLIVSNIPGTTMDSTDSPFHYTGNDFILIDTAGIRRRGKVGMGIERYGVMRSLAAISRCDVACLVLDYEEGIANQDLHVSQYILDSGKGLLIVVNKSDLMKQPEKERKKWLANLHYRMSYIPWAPVIFTSAMDRKNIYKIFELAHNIRQERLKKVSPRDFSIFLKASVEAHPPIRSGQSIRITSGEQTGASPPAFDIYTTKPELIHFSYRRFLENEIRRHFGFYGTPIRLWFKENWKK